MTERPEFSHKPRTPRDRSGRSAAASSCWRSRPSSSRSSCSIGVTTPLGNTAAPGRDVVDPQRDRLPHLVPAADRAAGRRDRSGVRRHERGRHDVPADRSRRASRSAWPTCGARPSGSTSGRPGARPASPRSRSCATSPSATRIAASRSSRSASRRRRRPTCAAYADALPARLHDRLRRIRRDLPRLQGVRAADPGLHRSRTGSSPSIVGAPLDAGRGVGADRGDPAQPRAWRGAVIGSGGELQSVSVVRRALSRFTPASTARPSSGPADARTHAVPAIAPERGERRPARHRFRVVPIMRNHPTQWPGRCRLVGASRTCLAGRRSRRADGPGGSSEHAGTPAQIRLVAEPVAVAHEPSDRDESPRATGPRSSPRRRPGRTAPPCG